MDILTLLIIIKIKSIMRKAIAVAVCGLLTFASAEMRINTPLKSFIKPKALLQSALQQEQEVANGEVTWGLCQSTGAFKADLSKTYSDPKVPVKGIDVTLNLNGVWTDDAHLEATKVYVEWNKTPLYVDEFSKKQDFHEGDKYTDKIKWNIPGFAPSGHYAVKITLHDEKNKNHGCLTADFDL